MGVLDSALSREDLETLIEAMGDWEAVENHEFHLMSAVKSAPMPSEDHEQYELVKQLKDYYKNREKQIKETRKVRQEKAIFTKAKLMLMRQDLGIGQLFNPPLVDSPLSDEGEAVVEAAPVIKKEARSIDLLRLALAEYFINDMGVWNHYRGFLADEGIQVGESGPSTKPEKEAG
jgi:hypothetical protein